VWRQSIFHFHNSLLIDQVLGGILGNLLVPVSLYKNYA
jgi:hypothetical protein